MNVTDKTEKKQGQWQPGQSGNPAGRPKGSRNRHSENFLNAFARDFEQHGAAVIEKVRKERPQDYLKVAAALLPKQMEIETNRTRPLELTDAELMELMLESTEAVVDAILLSRGHAALTVAKRHEVQQLEQEIGAAALPPCKEAASGN
jgi:hypothetical protein